MTEANFRTFQHYKSQKIMTYSSIVYTLLTRIWQQKTKHIKLSVPTIDAITMFSFSIWHKVHHKQLLHKWFTFSRSHSKISGLFRHLSPNSGLPRTWKIKRRISGPMGTCLGHWKMQRFEDTNSANQTSDVSYPDNAWTSDANVHMESETRCNQNQTTEDAVRCCQF